MAPVHVIIDDGVTILIFDDDDAHMIITDDEDAAPTGALLFKPSPFISIVQPLTGLVECKSMSIPFQPHLTRERIFMLIGNV